MQYICKRVHLAENDWCDEDENISLSKYLEKNFDKYFN